MHKLCILSGKKAIVLDAINHAIRGLLYTADALWHRKEDMRITTRPRKQHALQHRYLSLVSSSSSGTQGVSNPDPHEPDHSNQQAQYQHSAGRVSCCCS
jgi:hypothetical protein